MNPIINRKQDILYKDLAVDLTAHRVSPFPADNEHLPSASVFLRATLLNSA